MTDSEHTLFTVSCVVCVVCGAVLITERDKVCVSNMMSTWQIVIVYRGHTAVLTPDLVNVLVTIGVGGADW